MLKKAVRQALGLRERFASVNEFDAYLGRVSGGENLSMDEMTAVIDAIMRGRCDENRIARAADRAAPKGETVEEVAGAAAALRTHMTPIPHCAARGCSTPAAPAATARARSTSAPPRRLWRRRAGVPVAKHGNRASPASTGSADVLAELGRQRRSVGGAGRPLPGRSRHLLLLRAAVAPGDEARVGRSAARLGVRTIFNLLGPLANPAGRRSSSSAWAAPSLQDLLAGAMRLLGGERSVVVCGEDGLDEVTLIGRTAAPSRFASGSCASSPGPRKTFGLATAETAASRSPPKRRSQSAL